MSDQVANYLVARNGWPSVAVSAIFGSSVLNLFIGTVCTPIHPVHPHALASARVCLVACHITCMYGSALVLV